MRSLIFNSLRPFWKNIAWKFLCGYFRVELRNFLESTFSTLLILKQARNFAVFLIIKGSQNHALKNLHPIGCRLQLTLVDFVEASDFIKNIIHFFYILILSFRIFCRCCEIFIGTAPSSGFCAWYLRSIIFSPIFNLSHRRSKPERILSVSGLFWKTKSERYVFFPEFKTSKWFNVRSLMSTIARGWSPAHNEIQTHGWNL